MLKKIKDATLSKGAKIVSIKKAFGGGSKK